MERHCSVLIHYDVKGGGATVPPSEDELRVDLESNDVKDKVRGLKSLILLLLNGQSLPKLLMTVIRYCVTTRDHELKKLLSMYWEVVVKYDSNGKLLPEMILVCNAILNDLKHPNHFIRGCTLRFLCRVKDIEILQPLLPTVLENLAHSDPYVRKNAALVFFTVYQTFPDDCYNLLPDGPEIILAGLEAETDATARRNFFLFLCKTDVELALQFYQDNVSKMLKFGATFHFVFLEMVRRVCRSAPEKKPMFLKTIFQLLTSSSGDGALSTAISFEAAWTLISLSSAPTAVRTATTTFIGLLNNSESDNNIKLIVLERLVKLKDSNSESYSCGAKIIQENVLDILRVLSVPNSEIRRKALKIAMDLVSPRNIKQIVQVLKKEIVRTQDKNVDKNEANAYRQDLIKAIHGCAVRFPAIASTVVDLLMDFLTLQPVSSKGASSTVSSRNGSLEVVLFIREAIETYPDLRENILTKLINLLPDISSPEVVRVSLWLLGEYTVELGLSSQALDAIFEALGNRDFTTSVEGKEETDDQTPAKATASSVVILKDGTYATQSGISESAGLSSEIIRSDNPDSGLSQFIKKNDPPLRRLIIEGDYMISACILSCLLKVVLKLKSIGRSNEEVNGYVVRSVKLGCSILTFGRSKALPAGNQIDKDSYERINLYIKMFMDSGISNDIKEIILGESRKSLQDLLSKKTSVKEKEDSTSAKKAVVQPDLPLLFRQLRSGHKLGFEGDLDDEADLNAAVKTDASKDDTDDLVDIDKSLKNIYQLTGYGDPIYSEALITVHGYDIIVDVTVINKTSSALHDVSVELSALGDLQLMETAQSATVEARGVHSFKTSLKVSSTDSAQIFGTISYEDNRTKESHYINLNKIAVDIMDYIIPATCSDDAFRKMWAEFEWENKVAVNSNFSSLYSYLYAVVKIAHMTCLNLPNLKELAEGASTRGDSEEKDENLNFLAANLYARSIFGEDALVNVSVEQVSPTKVEGFIRIRAKTQGIALSLGERMQVRS